MRVWLLIICIICALPLSAQQWIGYRTLVATVYVHPGQRQLAMQIGRIAAEEQARLTGDLELYHPVPYPIFAYTDRGEFIRDAGRQPLLLGVSYRPSGLIRMDATGIEGPVREVLAHEIVHTLLNQRLGANIGSLPNWVNEGLAGFFATPTTSADLPLLSHLQPVTGSLTIAGMEDAFTTQNSVQIAYTQSRSMIAWLELQHPGSIQRLLDNLAQGKTFNGALYDSTGLTEQAWLEKWNQPTPLIVTLISQFSSTILYVIMAILVAVVAVKRLRRKREDREDDEEDKVRPTSTLPPPLRPIHTKAYLTEYPIWDDIRSCSK